MTKFHLALIAVGFIGVTLFAVIISQATAREEPDTAKPVPVPVLQVSMQEQFEVSSAWPGTVVARRQSWLGFERGGLIVNIHVNIGDEVRQGDRLSALDRATQKADLISALANVQQAQAALNLAQTTAKRQETLASSGHISPQRLEEVQANLANAEAGLEVATTNADAVRSRRSQSYITAPFDGTISQRNLDEGAIVASGTPVLELVETGQLELRVGLPADKAHNLNKDAVFDVTLPTGMARAKFERMSHVINPGTQTVNVVFHFTAENPIAVSGQTARIHLVDQLRGRGFAVPLSALREGRRGLWSLYELSAKDSVGVYILSQVPVDILYANEQLAYVRGPISDGQLVLESASQNTSLGMRVVPVDE
ncbi:MAG: efflux RND transporter periplasmic adaptor subunit [Robiginitomaculum sp.]|nr:efflux RND transporter periplasmic adaptor subunit [Robiginitomaculum sp.]